MALIDDWLFYSALVTGCYQFVFFLITVSYRFDKVTDLAGTSNFLLLAVAGLLAGGTYSPRQLVVAGLVALWALRLGAFLLIRVLVRRKDARFDKMRDSMLRLAGFWGLQAIWVWATSLPVTLLLMADRSRLAQPVDDGERLGWLLWAVGFAFEAIADQQRYWFNQRGHNNPRGRPFLDTGLWSISRHPNYFGECLLWFGIWLSVARVLPRPQALLAAASPLLTFGLLTFVSGIPLAEARDDRRNHRLMAYKQYKHCTSILLPMPRPWYAQLPLWIKRWLFFDRYQLAFITPGLASPSLSASGAAIAASASSPTTRSSGGRSLRK